jgi:transcriptional regulator with XRE-family HTH domain
MSTTTPASPKSDYAQKFERWKATGPLYKYRKVSGMTMGGCASALGVSIGTVQNLEDGNRSPLGKFYFKKLCELLQTGARDVERVWSQWLKRKP